MENQKEYNKYENEVVDVDEVIGTDVKINPDYYIHHALIKAQNALSNENIKDAMQKYWMFAEHIETLCIAANLLSEKYTIDLKEYKKSMEDIKNMDNLQKNFKISMKKIQLMMGEVFSHKVSMQPLKI